MSTEKSLPSDRNIQKNEDKHLPSGNQGDYHDKSLPSTGSEEISITEKTVKQETLEDRIHKSTIAGGLKEIPDNFNDRNGDWRAFFSENYFKVLYLDAAEFKTITRDIIKNNYDLLKSFYDSKDKLYRSGSGAIPISIEQKYGIKFLNETPAILKLAYDTLMEPGGVEKYYTVLQNKRFEKGRSKIQPLLDTVATIKILDPSTEEMIKTKGIEADLTKKEIDSVIEEFLKDKKIVRGEYSTRFEEAERLFVHNIKKQLKDNLLSKEEEKELKEDLTAYNISIERYEDLLLQALREVKDCERETTLDRNKKEFTAFYYDLLFDYGLDDNENLDNNAAQKLFDRDSSPTEFFPLKQNTRENLVKTVLDDYKIKLVDQKIYFISEALKKLQIKSDLEDEYKRLRENVSYKLVLPKYREEIIKRSINIIEYVNELYFIEIGKSLYRKQCWNIKNIDIKELIANPGLLYEENSFQDYRVEIDKNLLFIESRIDEKSDLKKLYNIVTVEKNPSSQNIKPNFKSPYNKPFVLIKPDFEWLDSDKRIIISGEIANWAKDEYEFEKKYFESTIEDLLKKYKYGLPLDKQIEQEKNKEFHLSEDERRNIIISKEKPLRQKAEKLFTELVESKIGNSTIIPELIKYLNNENDIIYFLIAEKNKISFKVQTSQEIISYKSKPFERVFQELIIKLRQEKQFEQALIKQYRLSKSACISQDDVILEIKKFHFENEKQASELYELFKVVAEQNNFYIIEETAESEFQVFDIFNKAVEYNSKSYSLPLSEWLTDSFIQDMVKIAAAYGVSENKIKAHIQKYGPQYLLKTTPRWKEFFSFSGEVISILFVYRWLLSSYSPDWVFVENAGSAQKTFLFLDYLTCIVPFHPSISWAIFVTILIIPFAYNKSVKKLLRSFTKSKFRISVISVSLLLFISISSLLVRSSDQFKQTYIQKFINNANDYVQSRKYNEALKEYEKIFNLSIPEERGSFYYERGVIYERSMVANNSLTDADRALTDITAAINLNPNIAEYFLTKGSCFSFRGDISMDLLDYQRAKEAFIKAKELDPTLTEPEKALAIIDKKISTLKRKITDQERQRKYQKAGIFPDFKISRADIQLRTNHSFFSSTSKTLKRNEEVKKLDFWVSNDPDVVEVMYNISPSSDGVSIMISAGSLVKIIGKLDIYYIISYKTKQTEITGGIPKSSTKEIVGIEWVRIKTLSGNTGWVLKNDIVGL